MAPRGRLGRPGGGVIVAENTADLIEAHIAKSAIGVVRDNAQKTGQQCGAQDVEVGGNRV